MGGGGWGFAGLAIFIATIGLIMNWRDSYRCTNCGPSAGEPTGPIMSIIDTYRAGKKLPVATEPQRLSLSGARDVSQSLWDGGSVTAGYTVTPCMVEEVRIGASTIEVLKCPECKAERLKENHANGWTMCAACSCTTCTDVQHTTESPTYHSVGSMQVVRTCQSCEHTRQFRKSIPRLTRPTNSGSGYSGGGGSSSGGGGAGSSY